MSEPARITFSEASNTLMTFGKYAKDNKTLDQIAEDDEGLLYLDWLFGEMTKEPQFGYKAHIFDAMKTYLNDSSIKKEVGEASSRRRR